MKRIGPIILIVLGVAAYVTVGIIIRGYAFSVMWDWFLVPTLNLPVIGIAQSIGIAALFSYLTNQYSFEQMKRSLKEGADDPAAAVGAMGGSLLSPFLFLCFNWIVKLFM